MAVLEIRTSLEEILSPMNSLHERPEFNRTIRDNCTTSLLTHVKRARSTPIAFDISLTFNGWYPRRAFREGLIPNDAPFEEVMQRFAVNEKAHVPGVSEDFSQKIREGIVRP